MATGLALAVGVNIGGGAKLSDGSLQLDKILRLALSAGDDDNPFQKLGLAEDIIFRINDAGSQALLKTRVQQILRKYADRVRLKPGTDILVYQNTEGEIKLEFDYIDLDENVEKEFSTSL